MLRSRIPGSGSLSDEIRSKRVIDVLALCVWRLYQKVLVVDRQDTIARQKTALLTSLWFQGRRGGEEQPSSILACWMREKVGTARLYAVRIQVAPPITCCLAPRETHMASQSLHVECILSLDQVHGTSDVYNFSKWMLRCHCTTLSTIEFRATMAQTHLRHLWDGWQNMALHLFGVGQVDWMNARFFLP